MQIISQNNLEEIKNKLDIVDVVSRYVDISKHGKDYKGLCPFHNEKTPSFYVNEEKQIFHCFGCGKVGDVFKFIQEIEGLSFPESILKSTEYLHQPLSFEINSFESTIPSKQKKEEKDLISMYEKSADIYHHILLNTSSGEQALKYLYSRGITTNSITQFRLGYAPQERIVLGNVFSEKKYDELKNSSGLFFQKDDGSSIDRFYERIMFPIFNYQGNVVAFSGRDFSLENQFRNLDVPKYLNSPETLIFNKGAILYNYNFARKEIKEKNETILFEGYMDVISSWQSGIKNGVASMGTSLTNEQIKSISSISDTAVIAYDGDAAGREATNRAIDLLTTNSALNVKIIEFPNQLDPDEYIKNVGIDKFQYIMNHQQNTLFSFKKSYLKDKVDLSVESEKLEYIDNILKELAKVPSVIEREIYIKEISEEFSLTVESLKKQIDIFRFQFKNKDLRSSSTPQTIITSIEKSIKISKVEKAEMILINRLIFNAILFKELKSKSDFEFIHDEYQELFILLDVYYSKYTEFDLQLFISEIPNQKLSKKFLSIIDLASSKEDSRKEVTDCLQVLEIYKIEQLRNSIISEQKLASKNGDTQSVSRLAMEIINLTRQLKSYGVN